MEGRNMCLSCGCGDHENDHGDKRNITLRDIDQAADAAEMTRARVLMNVSVAVKRYLQSTGPLTHPHQGGPSHEESSEHGLHEGSYEGNYPHSMQTHDTHVQRGPGQH